MVPHILRSLTAPDAILALILALYLQYKQFTRRKRQQRQERGGAKVPLKATSLFHELFFTRLSVMVSPTSMASTLNANVVDLHANDGKKKKGKGSSGVMEIRSRMIQPGELVLSKHFSVFEAAMNLALVVFIGLIFRWVFGLIRSLRLSRVVDGVGGVCCSSYQGIEGDSRSSFERLMACVLIKSEGDDAGKLPLTVLLVCLFVAIYKMAQSSSNLDALDEIEKPTKDEKGRHIYRRVPRQKVKRFFAMAGATLSALWLFHTPSLLRFFGLFGLIEAAEELSARILLLGNLIGIVSIPQNDTTVGSLAVLQNLILTAFAMIWGVHASTLVEGIQETARNAAFILSSNSTKNNNKRQTPDEMMALLNTRIMLVIQAVAPLVIICTFFAESHFAETLTKVSRGGGKASFSKQYLQNSGQFVRAGLSWSFLGASLYTIKSLLQSYLNQASTVASAMSIYGEATGNKSKQTNISQPDPFSDRYSKVVPTAGKLAAFPAFVFGILAFAHIRGGDVSVHPGVREENIDAFSVSAIKGLAPAYSGEYATWIESDEEIQHASGSLLQAAFMSQSTWEETPFRDNAHRKFSDWMGINKYCGPPSTRAVKSMGRELNYMVLKSSDAGANDDTTLPVAINGAQLLEFARPVPFTLVDVMFGSNIEKSCSYDNSVADSKNDDTCTMSKGPAPTAGTVLSSISSHSLLTPTVCMPIVQALSLLSSAWWTIWYTMMVILYWIKIRKAAGLHISA